MHTSSSAAAVPAKPSGLSLGVLLFRLRALIALFVLIGVFSILSPSFFTEQNLIILVGQTAINAIMAVGMTFVILTGGIDLSVGSTVGLAAMVSGLLINRGLPIPPLGVAVYFNIPVIIVIGLCLGCSWAPSTAFLLLASTWHRSSRPWALFTWPEAQRN